MNIKIELEYSGKEANKVLERLFPTPEIVKKAIAAKPKRKVGRPRKTFEMPKAAKEKIRLYRTGRRRHTVIARRENILKLLSIRGTMTANELSRVMGEPIHNIYYDLEELRKSKRIVKNGFNHSLVRARVEAEQLRTASPKTTEQYPWWFTHHFGGPSEAVDAIEDFIEICTPNKQITATDFSQFCFGMPEGNINNAWAWFRENFVRIIDALRVPHGKVTITPSEIRW
mgnify:CR=1 FL=1